MDGKKFPELQGPSTGEIRNSNDMTEFIGRDVGKYAMRFYGAVPVP